MESEKLKEELTWRCLVCRSVSRSVVKLKEHVSRHAFNVPVYQCKACKKHFNDKRSLLSHKRNVHGDNLGQNYTYNRSYICPLCGRRFSKKTTCVDHLLGHANMQHECKECGWVFESSYRLYVHGEFCHGRPGKRHTSRKHNQNKIALQNIETFDASKTMQENHNLESENLVSTVSRKKYRYAWKRTCSAEMDTYDELTTHMKVFHGVKNRTCPICSRNFADDKRLEHHVQHHFDMAYICLHFHCGHMFETWGVLRSHYNISHKKSIKDFNHLNFMVRKRMEFNGEKAVQKKLRSSCPICQRSFCDDYKLQHHVEHHCLLRYRCPESNCHYMYEIYNNLQAHCSLRHGVTLGVSDLDSCTVTAAEIGKQKELDASLQHVERIHKNQKCEICGRLFNTAENLNRHMENHENMQFKCPNHTCGWEFEQFGLFYSHCQMKHKVSLRENEQSYMIYQWTNGTKTFRCTHKKCTFNVPGAFSGYNELIVHLKTIHGPKDHKCPLCNRNFMSKKDFDEHTRDHVNLKYKCPENMCGWMYKSFATLYNHCYSKHQIKIRADNTNIYFYKDEKRTEVVVTQLEANIKDYACPTCNRVFKSQTKFYHHIENHASMKYKCKCGWEFTDFRSLQLHHQDVHKLGLQISRADEPWYRLQRVDCEATIGRMRTTRSRRRSVEVEKPKQRKYPCPFLKCEAGYQDFSEFERHLRFVHKKVSGTCALCDRGVFNNRLEFRVHLQKHTEGTTWFKCLYDGWMYHDLGSLRKHFKVDHGILKFPDEDDYRVVQDAVLGDDDSTSAYEDSNESDSDDGNKVEPADQNVVKNKVDHSKRVDFQTLARRRSTHIRCAFCNMTFDMDLELEEHACYRDIFITATEVKKSVEKDKETGDRESGTCTVEVHAPPKDQVVNWGGCNSDQENLGGTAVDVAELKTEAPDTTSEPSNLQSKVCQQSGNSSSLPEATASLKCQNTALETLPSSEESGIEMNVMPLVSLSQDQKHDRSLIGINASESVEQSLQVQPLLLVNGFSSPNSASVEPQYYTMPLDEGRSSILHEDKPVMVHSEGKDYSDTMTPTAPNNTVTSNADVDMLFNEFLQIQNQNQGRESEDQTFSFLLDTLEKTLQADDVDLLEVGDAVNHELWQPDSTGENNNKVVEQANQRTTQSATSEAVSSGAPVVDDEPIVIDDDCYIDNVSDSVIIID